jgi:hypothetical protein
MSADPVVALCARVSAEYAQFAYTGSTARIEADRAARALLVAWEALVEAAADPCAWHEVHGCGRCRPCKIRASAERVFNIVEGRDD